MSWWNNVDFSKMFVKHKIFDWECEMKKVVINRCFGGFGLSDDAVERWAELKGIKLSARQVTKFGGSHWYVDDIHDDDHYFSSYSVCKYDNMNEGRSDPILIQVVEEMGEKANGWAAELKIVEIPDDVEWYIDEYDGMEHVAEKHRTWS